MRVESARHRVEIDVEIILAAILLQLGEKVLLVVAHLVERFRQQSLLVTGRLFIFRGRVLLQRNQAVDHLQLEDFAPAIPQLRRCFAVFDLVRVCFQPLFATQIESFLQKRENHLADIRHTLLHGFGRHLGQPDLAAGQLIVDAGLEFFQAAHIFLQQKAFL